MKNLIDLIATGSGKNHTHLENAKEFIKNIGFTPRVSNSIFGEHPFYANSDEPRSQDLIRALYSEDSEIIWCFDGGSGTIRLIPFLNNLTPPAKPKMVIGLSDVTALLLFLSQKWGWQVVHGPTLVCAVLNRVNAKSLNLLLQVIQQKIQVLCYENLTPLNLRARENSTVKGLLTGGNMSLIEYSVGTSWQIKSQDQIIFFEDIDEAAYRIAERLEHLTQANIFKKAKAVLFGDFFHREKEKYKPHLVEFVLKDFAERIDIPCFSNLPVGHRENCFPLILNLEAQLITGQKGQLLQKIPH